MTPRKADQELLLRGHTGRVFLLVTLAYLAIKTGQRLLPPLLPFIVADFGITPFVAGIALSVMAVVRAVLQYPSGRFSDGLSRVTILLVAFSLGILGFVLLAATPTYLVFIASVCVLGSAIGLFDPAARALISDLFHQKRGRAFGLHTLAGDLAGIVAAGMAVVLTARTWRTAFVPSIGVLVLALVVFRIWSREAVVFEWVTMDVRETVGRLLRISRLRWALVAYAFTVFASIGVTSFLPTFLVSVHDFPVDVAGGAFALLYGVGIIVKPVSGWLSDRVPRLAIVGGGTLVASVSLLLLVLAPNFATAIAAVVCYAIGQRAFPPPFNAYLMDQFPDDSMGGDLGAMRTVYLGFGSLGPAYVGFVAGQLGYDVAFASIGLFFLGTATITLWLIPSR